MAKQYDPADVGQAFKQLAGLDNALEQAIVSRLREPQTNTESDVLFSERRAQVAAGSGRNGELDTGQF